MYLYDMKVCLHIVDNDDYCDYLQYFSKTNYTPLELLFHYG